jgi:hypothetical protein
MAGAAKTDAPSDLLDRQNRLICEKLLRRLHANTGQIAVGRSTDGLAERTLEMPSAHADELSELLQTNRVTSLRRRPDNPPKARRGCLESVEYE